MKDRRIDLVSRHWIGGISVKTIGDILGHGILSECYTDYDGVFCSRIFDVVCGLLDLFLQK